MAGIPIDPQEFTDMVARLLRKMQPEYTIDQGGVRELLVNGRRLDLENLFRMVRHEPNRGQEIIQHYLDQLFSGDASQLLTMSLDFARPRIMPRIQPESIFEHLTREMVAHVPFVNGTVVVFVTDLPHMTISVTTEQVVRWGLTVEDLDEISRSNLDEYAPDLEIQLVESKEGGKAAILSEHDGYDAARLLLSGLFDRLAPQMGGDFYVATPARDMFVALSPGPEPFIKRLQHRVNQDFRRLPYPITNDFFYVTRDGVAGTSTQVQSRDEAA